MNAITYIKSLSNGLNVNEKSKFENYVMNALFVGNVLSYPLPKKTNACVRNAIAGSKEVEPFTITDPLQLMLELNNWIKYAKINNSEKSLFYDEKHKMIEYYIKHNRITNIVMQKLNENEDGFLFTIDNKYTFHQPKRYFPNMSAEFVGEYVPAENKNYDLNISDLYRFVVISRLFRKENNG